MSTSPIRDALLALSRNAEHVEALLQGGTVPQDALPRAVVAGLRSASAVRPAGVDSWRLHPRLREYLQDHLQMYPAFQSLTDIGARLRALQALRDEALQAHALRDYESLQHMLEEMSTLVYDVADATERNLRYLGGMMSIKYGAVTTLRAKEAQNRWYQQQADQLFQELNRLGRIVGDVERDADTRGWEVARLLRRTIIDALPRWQLRLSDIQAQLTQEIYKLRQVQENLRNLARADGFLVQHPSWEGIDAEPAEGHVALLKAPALRILPHVEPFDDDRQVRLDMAQIAQGIPLRVAAGRDREVLRVRVVQDLQEQPVAPDPYLILLRQFAQAVANSERPLSVLGWAAARGGAVLRPPAPTAVPPSVWLMFTVCAMDGRTHRLQGRQVRFKVEEVVNPAEDGAIWHHTFRDALVEVAA